MTKTTVFVVANLFYFYFYFSGCKTELLLLTDVGWIGCRMDRLPAALVVWMPVLTDAGPARGPPALQVHVSWSLGNCIQLPVRKLDTGREGAKILDQFFLFG